MAVNQKLFDLLQEQVTTELVAAQVYLQLALHLEYASWEGTAAFFYAQAEEERQHAMTFARLLMERGHHIMLEAIPKTVLIGSLHDPVSAFREALEIERTNKIRIKILLKEARDKSYFDLLEPLGKLLAEQQTEVSEFMSQLDILERIEGNAGALHAFDCRLLQSA